MCVIIVGIVWYIYMAERVLFGVSTKLRISVINIIGVPNCLG